MDQVNGLDSLQISQVFFSSPIQPGATISDPSFVLVLDAPAQGDSATLPYQLRYDHHLDFQFSHFPITPWSPGPTWGDTLAVNPVNGVGTNVIPIIADPPLLNGHTYRIDFFENAPGGELLWRLTDQTTGTLKLDNQPLADDPNFPHPVVDGVQYVVKEVVNDFANFQAVANAAGPLDPPESAAAQFAGFPVNENPTNRQQVGDGHWFIHTADNGSRGSYEAFRNRTTRNGANWPEIIPFDFEIRFTARGSWTWDRFNTDT
ncbi:MAG: hypothetical protein GWN10_14145, partial [Nitrospinaceae bacterium]|nr:hypothetical protein [Nitrospinaceae bacterium]